MAPILSMNKDHWLVGKPIKKIEGSTLPLIGDVLRRFIYVREEDKKSVQESAKSVAEEILEIWNKTSIPCIEQHNVIKKIKATQLEWQNIKKNKFRVTEIEEKKRHVFVNKWTDLFDIARANALRTMKSENDKSFYRSQKDGKRGHTLQIKSTQDADIIP